MNRVLVTGGTGFLGGAVVGSLLHRGWEVHIATRRPTSSNLPQLHQTDLLDADSVSRLFEAVRPTHLIHLAWYTDPSDVWHSALNAVWADASVHLVKEFARFGGERCVIGGTCAEYEWSDQLLQEYASSEVPATAYGVAKLSLLRSVEAVAQIHGLSYAWARLFFLFGENERADRFVPSIAAPLLRGQSAVCRNGNLRRDYMYVGDAADALSALALSDVQGVVNIASGNAAQLREIAQVIAIIVGEVRHLSIVSGLDSTQHKSITAATTRLKQEVGWIQRYGLREGLERTVEWWRVHA